MASDQLAEIRDWMEYMQTELDEEQIGTWELIHIDNVYNLIKKSNWRSE